MKPSVISDDGLSDAGYLIAERITTAARAAVQSAEIAPSGLRQTSAKSFPPSKYPSGRRLNTARKRLIAPAVPPRTAARTRFTAGPAKYTAACDGLPRVEMSSAEIDIPPP